MAGASPVWFRSREVLPVESWFGGKQRFHLLQESVDRRERRLDRAVCVWASDGPLWLEDEEEERDVHNGQKEGIRWNLLKNIYWSMKFDSHLEGERRRKMPKQTNAASGLLVLSEEDAGFDFLLSAFLSDQAGQFMVRAESLLKKG
jgi:hypothetical protein